MQLHKLIKQSKNTPVTTNTLLWLCLLNGDQFRPQLGQSSDQKITRKCVRIETKNMKIHISNCTSMYITNYMPIMKGKNSTKDTKEPPERAKIIIFV